MKHLYIINGVARSGKDTVVGLVEKLSREIVINLSTVDLPKQIAKTMGWDGFTKDDKSRKLISDIKDLITNYNDGIFFSLKQFCLSDRLDSIIFIHCREPKEIAKFKDYFGSSCTTLLVTASKRINHVPNNHADQEVNNYVYDKYIDNDGTLEELEEKVKRMLVKESVFL